MLILTGTLPKSKKSVMEHQMTAKEVMEEFGIPQMGKHTEFELMPTFRKKDPRNGEIRTGRQQNFSPVYDLQLPEVGTVQIRFAESRVAKSGGGYDYKVANDRITDLRGEKMVIRSLATL